MCLTWLYSVNPLLSGSYYGSLDKNKTVFGLASALSVFTEEQRTCGLGANTVATHWGEGEELLNRLIMQLMLSPADCFIVVSSRNSLFKSLAEQIEPNVTAAIQCLFSPFYKSQN